MKPERQFSASLLPFLVLWVAAVSGANPTLRFEGQAFFHAKQLESEVALPAEPESLSRAQWRSWELRAEETLEALYADKGFFDAEVRVERGSRRERGDENILVFRIEEGVRYNFALVSITVGADAPILVDMDALEAENGAPFEREKIHHDRRMLAKVYGNKGYVHVRVAEDVTLVPESHSVRVDYKVHPGNLVVYDTMLVANVREGSRDTVPGLTRLPVFQSLMGLQRGDTVSAEKVAEVEKKLRSTGIFTYVRIKDSLLSDAGGRSALLLKSEEAIPGEIQSALFYETQYGPGISASWRHFNLAGRMHEGKWGATLAQRRQNLSLGYGSPLLFGTSWRFDNDVYMNWYQDRGPAYHSGIYDGDFEVANDAQLSRIFFNRARLISSAELQGESRLREDDSRLRGLNLNYINSAFLTYLDNLFNPTHGWRTSFTWGNGGPLVRKGDFQFYNFRHNWVEGKAAAYLPFGIALRGEAGRFFGNGGLNSQRFFLGGPRSVRSYGWRTLCPRLNEAVGCENDLEPAYGLVSLELRIRPVNPELGGKVGFLRHLTPFQWVPFIDYGVVWPVGASLHPEGEGLAVGMGLRYSLLAIFNLRLDYARDPRREDRSQWVLDLAQAF